MISLWTPRIVNGWSNHTGLAAWNLWLNNVLAMWRYYRRTGWPEYTSAAHYRKQAVRAFFFGWTPWQLRLRRAA